MTDNKKARSAADAAKQAAELEAVSKTALYSDTQCITENWKRQEISAFLLPGEENAMSSADLVRLTGYGSNRELQYAIQAEREHGALILSTCRCGGGYFLPAAGEQGRRELLMFERTLRARALNTLRSLKAARAALAIMEGQEAVDNVH